MKKFVKNYVLKLGIVFFIIGILLNVVFAFYDQNSTASSKLLRFNNFSIFVAVYGILFAPLIEEVLFRSIFTDKKYLKYIFYFGVFLFTLFSGHYFIIPLIILFIFAYEFKRDKEYLIYLLNALIFSLNHYNFSDLFILKSYSGIISIFGAGLVLIWIVLNFGLLYSILLHTIVNFSGMLSLLLPYEMKTDKIYKAETEDFLMTYKANSYLQSNLKTDVKTDMKSFIMVKNSNLEFINSSLCPNSKFKKLYFGNYDIVIKRKPESIKKLDCTAFQQLLDKSKITEQ